MPEPHTTYTHYTHRMSTVPADRLRGLAFGRASGFAVGLFLIFWGPLSVLRWAGGFPHGAMVLQGLFMSLLGVLLLLPWSRLPKRAWKVLFTLLCLGCGLFAFIQVIDLIFQYMLAAEFFRRPAPPAFQGVQLFLILLQPPVILFSRYPRLLD